MSLTHFQREVLQLIGEERKRSGESDIAGGVALNVLTAGLRRSRDIDLFHDTAEALQKSWDGDRRLLEVRCASSAAGVSRLGSRGKRSRLQPDARANLSRLKRR